jgi:hypothetical protein
MTLVHEHLASHRLDRRLLRRRNWVSAPELEKELNALPDVADKIRIEEEPPAPEEPARD